MIIFDALTFTKEAAYLFTTGNVAIILEKAREEIINQAKKEISGHEKKSFVDSAVIFQIREFRNTCHNKLVLWVIDQIIKVIPTMTQFVYDFLKEKIDL